MKEILWKSKRVVVLASIFVICSVGTSYAQEASTVEDAFKGGKISGTIGNFIDLSFYEAADSNSGWVTNYLTLKYETLSWNNLKFATRFFAHGESYSEHEDDTTDPFGTDIEEPFTVPELYLNYSFFEDSSVTIGRWRHGGVAHIDDSQSEGGYISFKEIDKLEVVVGAMVRYASISYSDAEDFGRNTGSQDVDNEATYGPGSGPMVNFVDIKYQPIDLVKFNPYFMYHNNYASLMGMDTTFSAEWQKHEVKYGGVVKFVRIDSNQDGSDNSVIYCIRPYVEKGPVKFEFNYANFDDGDAFNKPGWMADNWDIANQGFVANDAGAEMYQPKIKVQWNEKLWTHFLYSTAHMQINTSTGDASKEYEFQGGYNITDSVDVAVWYSIVTFDNVDDKDYSKFEARTRFQF